MRKLAIGAAVSGALALTGLAAPAALADSPDLTFGAITVNSGKPIVVGTKAAVTVPVTYSVTRPTAFKVDYKNNFLGIALYRGRLAEPDNAIEGSPKKPVCTPTATTDTTVTESCATKLTIDPRDSLFEGADATTWKAAAFYSEQAIDEDDSDDHISFHLGSDIWGNLGTAKLQRLAKATVNATPEPVVKGKTLTVKGTLTRADWDASRYAGYKGQKVTLQFKAKGATAYTDVKTVTSGTAGALSTTVKASKDGSYRYKFAGTSTTAAKTSAADFVDVK
ncbi:hypothetical protein OG920_15765 [Streptomyces europaeiscabiei]|uniref:hypothetical protein n=1 Tax=Streptomyces TaxID=1883 RepID=UPI000A38008F|nr:MULTISPECIES: hypothetical protein [Streptomyces]MDX3584327.1 hypothetical protein [Streptomyces europaeiscabiei]MDX3615406.1 hypothetical protein [Streptomyces europaeiscabiei]MDX3629431.1 hypothetical protein [Streptomyces europaeiscabiei]MDX3648048.1 hypothetical protein [Streptomyces europaeiscabiei]WUD32764.1 hypothetical protein OG858_15880 [Streptomyces europaeiscabiei]